MVTFTYNVSKLERAVIQIHTDCLRNMREDRNQDEVQARVWGLLEAFFELQDEYQELRFT